MKEKGMIAIMLSIHAMIFIFLYATTGDHEAMDYAFISAALFVLSITIWCGWNLEE